MAPRKIKEHPGHGTNWGYEYEWRNGLTTCEACREAHREHVANYRANNPEAAQKYKGRRPVQGSNVRVPMQMFRDMYLAVDPQTAARIDEVMGKEKVDRYVKRADTMDHEAEMAEIQEAS